MTGTTHEAAELTAGTDSECSARLVDAGKVALVKSQMPRDIDVVELAAIFGLLSDPGRVRILTALLSGEMCVCDVAATTGLSESGVSHALRLLRASRVVEVRRSGRMAYYSLADSHVSILLELGLKHVGHTGQQRLAMADFD
ncbi:metalloregulator ArsR/SmtB family transcription factor [Arthrobacter alpinus]|uniref:ArsR/SmtB family transcription factor n=1 Tax=Arthrobacter sp. N199823 TaxID=2058895 RepID=UPI000CE3E197|nr:metalloregulator ArsR/SmtB family transcription factor [Arthrobacter sp. N199823]MDD0856676.1 metalloregulator ArsR/SmtB family transcription factor [Arthrobacter alpinus]